jgi:Extensin-like protein C-terminus
MYRHDHPIERLGEPIPRRCRTAKLCPTVLHRAAPFDSVAGVRTTKHGGAPWQVTNVEQGLVNALTGFVRDAQQLVFLPAGLLLVSVRSMGAHNCRCMTGTDTFSGHAFGRAIDISGWTFRERAGAGAERVVIYERLVRAGQWLPLHRMGACLHLNFGQVLDWAFNKAHENHFHAEIKDSPAIRWRFVDRLLSFTLGPSLPSLGWVESRSPHAKFAPGPDAAEARVKALTAFASRAPVHSYTLFLQRFGRPWTPTTGEMAKLLMLHVARNGFRL